MRIVDHRCRSSIVDADRRSSMSMSVVDSRCGSSIIDVEDRCRCRSSMSVVEDQCRYLSSMRSSIVDAHRRSSMSKIDVERCPSLNSRCGLSIVDVDRRSSMPIIDVGYRRSMLIVNRLSMLLVTDSRH